jgi:exoribonuclease-2
VNQWQIVAVARPGRTAPLVAPFKPKDAALFSVISGFDANYSAYNDFQQQIERYWTLRHLQQAGTAELDAAVMKEGLVRAEALPLVFRVPGTEGLPRGARVRARVAGVDLMTLELHATLAARLDAEPAPADESGDDDESEPTGALQLAIELTEAEPTAEPAADTGAEAPAPPAA